MKRSEYQAGPPLRDARVERADPHVTLVFTRELRHPPHRVWAALTDPAALSAWAPFDADRDLGHVGGTVLRMAGVDAPAPMATRVLTAESPRLLEYTWGDDVLRWELTPSSSGTRLTLRHRSKQHDAAAMFAAGWHICLDVAEAALDGAALGRIVARDAMDHGWSALRDAYAARLGDHG